MQRKQQDVNLQTRERYVEKKLVDGIAGLGGRCLKWVSPGTRGVPDRIVLLPGGRVLFVEVKRDGGSPSKLQKYWHRKLKNLGMDARFVEGVREVEELLDELGR